MKAEQPEAEQRNLLVAASLNPTEKKLYELLSTDESSHIDEIVERSGLNSSEVLATLFNLEMKDIAGNRPANDSVRCCFSGRYGATNLPFRILHLSAERTQRQIEASTRN